MWVFYLFYFSLLGIIILLSLKVWELKRGAKPFSVLRYRLDLFFRRKMEELRGYQKYLNTGTIRLTLAFLVAKASKYVSMFFEKVKESHLFKTIKGKVSPGSGTGPVSAFLRDVAEFKNAAAGESEKKAEEEKKSE
jgi:hypothetical protein